MDLVAVLFDIDGTLLDTRGAGRQSFVEAVQMVFGWKDDLAYIDFAGNTDLNVLEQVMKYHGRTLTTDDTEGFFARLPEVMARNAARAKQLLYPGVKTLLERLSGNPRFVLGLVTGNQEASARIKLGQFDLHNHFVLGAFGNEHADRPEIARLALRRVREWLPPGGRIASVFLIGDTPYDIAAAQAIGAVSIAVATGSSDEAALRAAGADHVFRDLSDTSAVLNILGSALK